jgi:hypothetical protein
VKGRVKLKKNACQHLYERTIGRGVCCYVKESKIITYAQVVNLPTEVSDSLISKGSTRKEIRVYMSLS